MHPFPPLNSRAPFIWHGGDYNPEQWPRATWDEDIRLMQECAYNVATVGVFSWTSLQPEEDRFTFEWLDTILEKLAASGRMVCLATPSAAQPAWMSQRYPDVLRVDAQGNRRHHGWRVNYCPTSPDYRRFASQMAKKLAERYHGYPALVAWHVSNEYMAACYCNGCAAAFREWLEQRYASLDELNQRWWTAFWSHTYTDWSQIEPPYATGEQSIHALVIDYQRFFVRRGGTFVTTYFSGMVDECDLAFEDGYPGPLREVLGIWNEEIDALAPAQKNRIVLLDGGESYTCGRLCALVRCEGASALATYGDDFYAGTPAVTRHGFGAGQAYYLASEPEPRFLDDFYARLLAEQQVEPVLETPRDVEATVRQTAQGPLLFLLNHRGAPARIILPASRRYRDLLHDSEITETISLVGYDVAILAEISQTDKTGNE